MSYLPYPKRGKILHRTLNASLKWEKYLDSRKDFESTGPDGNAEGMKRLYWGLDAYVVKCNHYLYKVDEATYRKIEADAY